jgi:subtilisin family serine protease
MDKHTFIGKRKIGSTEICDFTDFQGIGRDPLYRRYESIRSIVKRVIAPEYAHFLAIPNYSEQEDIINWYVDAWNETPERFVELNTEQAARYQPIKEKTINYYKSCLDCLSGEDLQVMICALRYINDEFIYCSDGKVYLVAWGMTPDLRKHVSCGQLIHESPSVIKHKVVFDPGEHGNIVSSVGNSINMTENTEIQPFHLPEIAACQGYRHIGWEPNPLGVHVTSDLIFTAVYEEESIQTFEGIENDDAVPLQDEDWALVTFDAGQNGFIDGESQIYKRLNDNIQPDEIPIVTPNKGYKFVGWDINPKDKLVNGDVTFHATYKENLPWYKRFGRWLSNLFPTFGRFSTGGGCLPGCLSWLWRILLGILLLLLIFWLLRSCHGCSVARNGVVDIDRIVDANGNTIDDNGIITPIDVNNNLLPTDPFIVAPIRGDDGQVLPIHREPGAPSTINNRLYLFLEDENDDIDALAADFKSVYSGNEYSIIGYDREVKSLLIQIPEEERDVIRQSINSKIPNHRFIVFDEEIYELNGGKSSTSNSKRGWHLEAVKAQEGWLITKGSRSIKVAVVDDGIDASHPMFKGRIVDAYNVYTQNNQLSCGEGHGTHTAGLAVGGSEYLSKGASGIAPECLLIPVQVIDNGLCPLSALISGVMYAIHKDADVVNISIGPTFQGLNQLPIEAQEQIAQTQFKNVEKLWSRVCHIAATKNTILVFAAGNDDILSSIPPENRNTVALTVGAVDEKLYPTDFTNYGDCTDISAPGKEIYSSFPIADFASCDGTSMAAPIVTGTIALMKTLNKNLTVEQARNVLHRTGMDVYGNMPPMVQVNLALEAVKQGDYSAPSLRSHQSIPNPDAVVSDGTLPPASWTTPIDVGVNTPIETYPGEHSSNPIEVQPPSVDDNETDYEAIRRLISFYKDKIIELEGQLPENKKRK